MPEEIAARRYCFGCGDLNPAGLKLDFRFEGNKAVADFLPQEQHQGYPGLMHGGVISTALDEAMGWAMYYAFGVWTMTGKMEVKFRRPLPLHQKAMVSAEVTRNRGRWLEVRGEIRNEEGRLIAESCGLFMRLPDERVRELASGSEEAHAEGRS
jgi:acyl-coenzyme A thioesterase PaaI-like protein